MVVFHRELLVYQRVYEVVVKPIYTSIHLSRGLPVVNDYEWRWLGKLTGGSLVLECLPTKMVSV